LCADSEESGLGFEERREIGGCGAAIGGTGRTVLVGGETVEMSGLFLLVIYLIS
jgi:hypothetical protein